MGRVCARILPEGSSLCLDLPEPTLGKLLELLRREYGDEAILVQVNGRFAEDPGIRLGEGDEVLVIREAPGG
ncbi:MAG: MoaD/ThiS family protein [Desulfurococcaceae archaeon]